MWAPKLPAWVRTPWAVRVFTKWSTRGWASAGSAAVVKPGRRPREVSAYSVNWLTTRASPPTSVRLRLKLPGRAGSGKMRRAASLVARWAGWAWSPVGPAPSRIARPRPSRRCCAAAPSPHVTDAARTRWATNHTSVLPPPNPPPLGVPRSVFGARKVWERWLLRPGRRRPGGRPLGQVVEDLAGVEIVEGLVVPLRVLLDGHLCRRPHQVSQAVAAGGIDQPIRLAQDEKEGRADLVRAAVGLVTGGGPLREEAAADLVMYQAVGLISPDDGRIPGDGGRVDLIAHGQPGQETGGQAAQLQLPGRDPDLRLQGWAGQHETAYQNGLPDHGAEQDHAAEGVPDRDHLAGAGVVLDHRHQRGGILHPLRPALDMTARPLALAHPAEVHREGRELPFGHGAREALVAAGVLAQAVDHGEGGPRRRHLPGPPKKVGAVQRPQPADARTGPSGGQAFASRAGSSAPPARPPAAWARRRAVRAARNPTPRARRASWCSGGERADRT